MTLDIPLAIGGLLVGVIVGLTGMGGGALMTPMLVFFFKVDPLTAISSDLVASFVMKPAGAAVHLRRKTVNLELVKFLCLGSVPAAFLGAWVISLQPRGEALDEQLKVLLGLALLLAAGGLVARALFQMWQNALPLGEGAVRMSRPEVVVKPVPTILLGAAAGFVVGITSVGSGSIVIVALLLIYPGLKASSLVGTDLTQAIPLVGAAALGHLLFGSFEFGLTASLLLGAIPGAFIGAHISSRAPGGVIRRALAVLLLASGLRLLGLSTELVLVVAIAALVGGSIAWIAIRRTVKAGRRNAAAATPDGDADTDADPADPAEPADPGARDAGGGEPGAGAVVFLTGLSGSGKSTIAEELANELRAGGREVTILDGDVLRQHLSADLGFDRASREANVRRAAEIAEPLAAGGQLVISALIAPFDQSRRDARALVERSARFLLVWLSTPIEVTEARDPKGLYSRARAGEIPDFTGIDSPYEPPTDADLVLDTSAMSVDDAVAAILERIDRSTGKD